jgi:hypothetical protein
MPTGDVQITIQDSGAGSVVVPQSSVQVVIGCSSAGTANQVVATRSLATLQSQFGYGPLPEAAALAALAGGTVLAVKAATATAGTVSTVTTTGGGTSVVTVSGSPNDDYQVQMSVLTGGTIGTSGITFKLSLDAGRNFGPVIALGTANSYAIPNTGLTLNFGAGTMLAGQYSRFSATAPTWNTAGIQAALNALQASPYAVSGWGSMHIVGVCSGANASTIDGYLSTLASGYVFTRALVGARDAAMPTAWGGSGETESAWANALSSDYSATSAKRICASAGHYNMPSAYPNPAAGTPRYRRSLSWALAARQVRIPPQRHSGRVKDGPLSEIVVDPISDPTDGFIYHDERINPSLDAARFHTARTRVGLTQAFYSVNPNLMSPAGSDFSILPLGNVMDVACGIVHTVGQQQINSDVRLNANGTIFENDAIAIEVAILSALNAAMTSQGMISSATVSVDRTTNVQTTKAVAITVVIVSRGYILQENVSIGFSNPARAGG